jgi:hypothetical protein
MSFASDVAKFAQKAGKSVDETGRAIVLELFGSVIKDTPVDTGRARGNWQTTMNSPATTEIARDGAQLALNELSSELPSFVGDKTIYLANNLPYIHRLEFDGWSQQSPEGMVRKNVARIQSIVKKAAQENKV